MTKVLTAEEHICFPQEPTMPVPKPPKCKDQPVLLPLTVETNKLKPRHRLYFQSKAFLNRAAATTAKPVSNFKSKSILEEQKSAVRER